MKNYWQSATFQPLQYCLFKKIKFLKITIWPTRIKFYSKVKNIWAIHLNSHHSRRLFSHNYRCDIFFLHISDSFYRHCSLKTFCFSWALFWLGKKTLYYESGNLRHSHKTAHKYLFDATKTIYIGLNRIYEDGNAFGTGLCEVACGFGKPPYSNFTAL